MNLAKKIQSNIKIYQNDITTKGLYWSVIHRLYKLPFTEEILQPFVNFLKPGHVISHGQKIFIDKKDGAVSQELILSKSWEPFETNLFLNHIKWGDTVIDIGAHIGYYTLLAAQRVGPHGKVYAFEPDPRNFSLLQKNVKENGYKNVILINKAVSDKSGKGKLFINYHNTGDNRAFDSGDGRHFEKIEMISMDDYFSNSEIKINLIKMDIQGYEVNALKGAKRLIKRNNDIVLITECWPEGLRRAGSSATEMLKILLSHSFKIFRILEREKKLLPLPKNKVRILGKTFSEETNLLCCGLTSDY